VVSSELASLQQQCSALDEELALTRRRLSASEVAARSKASEVEDVRAAYEALATEHRRAQVRRGAPAGTRPRARRRLPFR
jgi:chromosome segregation ATPase